MQSMMSFHQRMIPTCLLAGLFVGVAVLPGCSGDRYTTGTAVEKPPEAASGQKASMEFMKSRMMKGGMTKK